MMLYPPQFKSALLTCGMEIIDKASIRVAARWTSLMRVSLSMMFINFPINNKELVLVTSLKTYKNTYKNHERFGISATKSQLELHPLHNILFKYS